MKSFLVIVAVLVAFWLLRDANEARQRDTERAADAKWAEATAAQMRLAEENARRSRDAMKSIPTLNLR